LPLGLQLYTLGDAANKDIDGTLRKIRRIGYKTVELAGFHGHPPAVLRASADRAGLRFTSVHIAAKADDGSPGLDRDLAYLAADVHRLGASTVVMPGPILRSAGDGEITATLDDWKRTAAFLNEKGEVLRREGLLLGYHNHNLEFAPVAATTGFDVLVEETDPHLVTLEMDAGWVRAAGLDPIELLKRYPERFRLMHVKEIRASTRPNFEFLMDSTEVGRGIIDWRRVIPAAYAAGVREYFVEQEGPFETDRFTAIGDSFKFLDAMR
jgi:sugar phosphate isomerase/epimerase